MTIARVGSKGRVTLPLEVRQRLRLVTGSGINFVIAPEGKVLVEPVQTSVMSLEGVFHSAHRRPVSLDEMDCAVAEDLDCHK